MYIAIINCLIAPYCMIQQPIPHSYGLYHMHAWVYHMVCSSCSYTMYHIHIRIYTCTVKIKLVYNIYIYIYILSMHAQVGSPLDVS